MIAMKQRVKETLVFSFDEVADILKDKVNIHRNHDVEKLSVQYDIREEIFIVHYDSEEFDGGSYA